jgi:hypothetical protein
MKLVAVGFKTPFVRPIAHAQSPSVEIDVQQPQGPLPSDAANLVDPSQVVAQGRASACSWRTSHYSGR